MRGLSDAVQKWKRNICRIMNSPQQENHRHKRIKISTHAPTWSSETNTTPTPEDRLRLDLLPDDILGDIFVFVGEDSYVGFGATCRELDKTYKIHSKKRQSSFEKFGRQV